MSLNVELLKQSFENIKPHGNEFVASFYENLFADHPEVKPLFANTNMVEQRKHLLSSLVLVVENLQKPEVLEEALHRLGKKHVRDGITPQSYPLVGEVLLKTMESYLEENWTFEVKQAWISAYGAISATMLEAAGKDDA